IIRLDEPKKGENQVDASVVALDLVGMLLGLNLQRRLPKTNSIRVLVAIHPSGETHFFQLIVKKAEIFKVLLQLGPSSALLQKYGGRENMMMWWMKKVVVLVIMMADVVASQSPQHKAFMSQEESVVRGSPWGVGVFEVVVDGQDANETLVLLSHLLHQARQ
ncbi:hypothetical protein Hamer_G002713, partial [Homarus americanus]